MHLNFLGSGWGSFIAWWEKNTTSLDDQIHFFSCTPEQLCPSTYSRAYRASHSYSCLASPNFLLFSAPAYSLPTSSSTTASQVLTGNFSACKVGTHTPEFGRAAAAQVSLRDLSVLQLEIYWKSRGLVIPEGKPSIGWQGRANTS